MSTRLDLAVQVRGIDGVAAALLSIDPAYEANLARSMRVIARDVAAAGSRFAPRKSGALSRSIEGDATASRAVVFSTLPYAPIHEFGGVTQLRRGHTARLYPTPIRGSYYLKRAIEASTPEIRRQVSDALVQAARERGFTVRTTT